MSPRERRGVRAAVRPRHRPPVALRVGIGLLGLAMLTFNAMIMLSDRAPGVLRRLFGDVARRVSERVDAGGRPSRLATDPRLPESDTIVHIVVWGLAILLVGLAVWTWRGLAVGAVAVFVTSVIVEVLQGRVTETRVPEYGDVVANAVGVAAGSLVVTLCYLGWSAAAAAFGDRRIGRDR